MNMQWVRDDRVVSSVIEIVIGDVLKMQRVHKVMKKINCNSDIMLFM